MDAYALAVQKYLDKDSEGILMQALCRVSCRIRVEAPPAQVRGCKISCKKATMSQVEVHYEFELKKGSRVKAIVEVFKGRTRVGSGSWIHETPGWCWAQVWTDWCKISEDRKVSIKNVRPGDTLTVRLTVVRA